MATILKAVLEKHAVLGELYASLENDEVRCLACAHECRLKAGQDGICRVRFNRDGKLLVPKNYVAGLAVDPIEKKPFFHVLPGSEALSFGMLGCDFRCDFCQNWVTTQALHDPEAGGQIQDITSDQIISMAKQYHSPVITSTYNEPLITSEWAHEIFEKAKHYGIRGAYVSNGHATEAVLDYLRPVMDLYKVDLKCFNEKNYLKLGGKLKAVLNAIEKIKEKGFWLEVVTLIVPELNDSDEELKNIAKFLASLSKDIPWHVTAFHPDYKRTKTRSTPLETLLRAVAIGREAGLRFVYAGNLPGQGDGLENTRCPQCQTTLIERVGFRVLKNRLSDGKCPDCKTTIPGVWK